MSMPKSIHGLAGCCRMNGHLAMAGFVLPTVVKKIQQYIHDNKQGRAGDWVAPDGLQPCLETCASASEMR